jgi:drug/metabolite transporter (DMT)-like permease
VALAILGALTITYRSGESVALGIAATLFNAFGLALQSFLVKRHIHRIDNFEVLAVRSAVALVGTSIFFLTSGQPWPPISLLPDFFFWAGIGYVAFNLLLYFSLRHADLAKVAALSVITPPAAMLGAYWVFGTTPTASQILGGLLILAGVSLILLQPLLKLRAKR